MTSELKNRKTNLGTVPDPPLLIRRCHSHTSDTGSFKYLGKGRSTPVNLPASPSLSYRQEHSHLEQVCLGPRGLPVVLSILYYFLLWLVWKEDMEIVRTSMSEAVISEETELKEFRKKLKESHHC